jgi:hypothetical protein
VELAKKKEELQAVKTDLESKIRENGTSALLFLTIRHASLYTDVPQCGAPMIVHNREVASRKR